MFGYKRWISIHISYTGQKTLTVTTATMDLKSALLLGVIALACLQVSNVEGKIIYSAKSFFVVFVDGLTHGFTC